MIRDEGFWERFKNYAEDNLDRFYLILKKTTPIGYFMMHKRDQENHRRIVLSEYGWINQYTAQTPGIHDEFLLKTLYEFGLEMNCNEIGMKFPETYPLVQKLLEWGGRNVTGWLSGLMANIIRLDLFLPKFINAQHSWMESMENKLRLNGIADLKFSLRIENWYINYAKSGDTVEISLSSDSRYHDVCKIDRMQFTRMIFGNLTVSDLVDSDLISFPDSHLDILDVLFPVLPIHLLEMDRF